MHWCLLLVLVSNLDAAFSSASAEFTGWDGLSLLSAGGQCGNCNDTRFGQLGCDVTPIEICVCELDPYCCTDSWDMHCSDSATEDCLCDVSTTQGPCGNCTEVGSMNQTGCDIPEIESCVCAIDPDCCTELWDSSCATLAASPCNCGVKTDQDCLDELDLYYNGSAALHNTSYCNETCYGDPGLTDQLDTDSMPALLPDLSGADTQTIDLALTANQKYNETWVSLVNPFDPLNEDDRHYREQFVDWGRRKNATTDWWDQAYTLEQCWNEYNGTFSWKQLCNESLPLLVKTDAPGFVYYTGFIAVDSLEELQPIRNTALVRWIKSKLIFRVAFNKQVMITTGTRDNDTLAVFDMWNALFATVEQRSMIMDAEADPPKMAANITLFASTQWPFELSNPVVTSDVVQFRPNLTVERIEHCSDPAPAGGATAENVDPCEQRFRMTIHLGDECYFNGDYQMNFTVNCAPSVPSNECPLTDATNDASVTFTLESENLCPTILEEIVATGEVTMYRNARNGTDPYTEEPHNAFFLDERVHMEIELEPLDGFVTDKKVTGFIACFNVDCSDNTTLYDEAANATHGLVPEVNFYKNDFARPNPSTPSALPLIADVHITLDSDTFSAPEDGSSVVQFVIKLEVDYGKLTGTLLQEQDDPEQLMRELLQNDGTEATDVEIKVSAQISHEAKATSSSTGAGSNSATTRSSLSFGILFLLAAVFLLSH